jgi:Flp pilus assembly protein TadD
VFALLIGALVFTGFAASFYGRERQSFGEMHDRRGEELRAQGKPGEAAEEFRKALLFSPDKTEYRVSLGAALIAAGRLDEAQAHLEQLLQDDPTNGRLNVMLAEVAARRHHTQQAIDFYHRAVYEYWPEKQASDRRKARWELVGLLGQAGRRNEAVGELMQLYANAPADPKIRSKVGFLLLQYGATSESARVFRDLVRDTPQDAQAHTGLGDAYFAMGDFVSARHEYQRVVRLAPKDPQIADKITLTTAVIDLDPGLPDISSSEQYRRSTNLLHRVLVDLGACPVSGVLQQRLDSARALLLTNHSASSDINLDLQNMSLQLWNDRGLFCPKAPVTDRVVEAALRTIQS